MGEKKTIVILDFINLKIYLFLCVKINYFFPVYIFNIFIIKTWRCDFF